jgi:hypothetical protein
MIPTANAFLEESPISKVVFLIFSFLMTKFIKIRW